MFYPSLQKGNPSAIVTDEDTQEKITVGFIRQCVADFEPAVQYVVDWQNGLFTIERRDYERMPNVLMRILRIHQNVKREIAAKEKARAQSNHANKS